jgi:IS605 OrfB family transposase
MKIIRSSKCSVKFATNKKKIELQTILKEYGKVVNIFIDYFWDNKVDKTQLLKPIVDIPKDSWLSARLRKVAAREALDMVSSVKNVFEWNKEQIQNTIDALEGKIKNTESNTRENRRKINNWYKKLKASKSKLSMIQPHKPKHKGYKMSVSCTIGELQKPKKQTKEFDAWLHLASIGNKISLDIPIKFHKHYRELEQNGQRLNSYIITKDYIQFSFERETGPKKEVKNIIGIDTGINALASTSAKEQFGTDIKALIEKSKRCKKGSKGKQRAINTIKQRINEVAKEVLKDKDLVVVEKLSNLNNNSKLKGRLSKNIRSSIGSWNYAYWLNRLEMNCEEDRVSFRTVSPYNTSITCPVCNLADSRNRNGEVFKCQACGYTDNADVNAALNIVQRFLTGKYGFCYKPKNESFLACPEMSTL